MMKKVVKTLKKILVQKRARREIIIISMESRGTGAADPPRRGKNQNCRFDF